MEFRPLLQGETPGVGVGIRSLTQLCATAQKVGKPGGNGSGVDGRSAGSEKGAPTVPSWDLALRAFSPPLSPREWRRGRPAEAKVRCRGS